MIEKEELLAVLPTLKKFEEELKAYPKPAKHVSETIRAIKYVTEGLTMLKL